MTKTSNPIAAAPKKVLDHGELCHRSFSLLRQKTAAWRIDADGLWSYPAFAPSHDGQVIWLMLISGAVPMPEHKKTAIFRPKAAVLTKAQLPQVIRYECWRHGHDPFPNETWDKPVAMFPHSAIGSLTARELGVRERELFAMYPDAQDAFRSGRPLPQAFCRTYLELSHPVFLKYIHALAKGFVTALLATA